MADNEQKQQPGGERKESSLFRFRGSIGQAALKSYQRLCFINLGPEKMMCHFQRWKFFISSFTAKVRHRSRHTKCLALIKHLYSLLDLSRSLIHKHQHADGVQCLAQGHFNMLTPGVRNRARDPQIRGRAAVPAERRHIRPLNASKDAHEILKSEATTCRLPPVAGCRVAPNRCRVRVKLTITVHNLSLRFVFIAPIRFMLRC